MRRLLVPLTLGALVVSCTRSLELPPPPSNDPGQIQGLVQTTLPGRAQPVAARGARVSLLKSALAVRTDSEGRFTLEGVAARTGTLLIEFDADGDGQSDKQKLISLTSIGAGPGRSVNTGTVLLDRNAALSGAALRADVESGVVGHQGTLIFVPETRFSTVTGPTGAFELENLPEGPVVVNAFAPGYGVQSVTVELRAGESFSLQKLTLEKQVMPAMPVDVKGRVIDSKGQPVAQLQVSLVSATTKTQQRTGADGSFRFAAVAQGVWALGVEGQGFNTLTVNNLLLTPESADLGDLVVQAGTSSPFDAGEQYAFDAGPVEAPDAGADAGLADGGQGDAGHHDAGPDDAGLPDAGLDAGADGGFDAGRMDAGPAPFAVNLVAPLFAAPDASVTLLANTTGGRLPYTYRWSKRIDRGLEIPIATSLYANSVADSVPAVCGARVEYAVQASDSADASVVQTVELAVGAAPTGLTVTPSSAGALMLPGQTRVFTAAATDPCTGLPANISWSVAPLPNNFVASVDTTSVPGQLSLTATQFNQQNTQLGVSIVATATTSVGFSIDGPEWLIGFTSNSPNNWDLVVPSPVTLTPGQMTLITPRALEEGADLPGARFSWSGLNLPDGGSIVDFVRVEDAGVLRVLAASQPPQGNNRLSFTVSAQVPYHQLTTRSTQVELVLPDTFAPQLSRVGFNQLSHPQLSPVNCSFAGFDVEFSESVTAASLSGSFTIESFDGANWSQAPINIEQVGRNDRALTLMFAPPLSTAGTQYRLKATGVIDLAGNAMGTEYVPLSVNVPGVSSPLRGPPGSAAPMLSLLNVAGPQLYEPRAFVSYTQPVDAGFELRHVRVSNGPQIFCGGPFDQPPCDLEASDAGTTVLGTSPAPPQLGARRSLMSNSFNGLVWSFAPHSVSDVRVNPTGLEGGWSSAQASTSGRTESLFANRGQLCRSEVDTMGAPPVNWYADCLGSIWGTTPWTVKPNIDLVAPYLTAGASVGDITFIAAVKNPKELMGVYRSKPWSDTGYLWSDVVPISLIGNATRLRASVSNKQPTVAATTSGGLEVIRWPNSGSTIPTNWVLSPVAGPSFDLLDRSGTVYVLYTESNQVHLQYLPANDVNWLSVQGGASLNDNPACTPDNLELASYRYNLYLMWDETCPPSLPRAIWRQFQ